MEKIEAIAATGRTASRAVFFSGTAFVIALTGMLLVPDTILRSLAAGAVLVGITAVAGRDDAAAGGALAARRQGRRAAAALRGGGAGEGGPLLGSGGDAGAAAAAGQPRRRRRRSSSRSRLPALDLRTGSAGVRTIPDGYASKDGFNALEREFGVGTVDSVEVVVVGDTRRGARARGGRDARAQRSRAIRPSARRSVTIGPNDDVAVVEALVAGDSRDEAAVQAVERLRAEVVPEALAATRAPRPSSPARRPRSSTTTS